MENFSDILIFVGLGVVGIFIVLIILASGKPLYYIFNLCFLISAGFFLSLIGSLIDYNAGTVLNSIFAVGLIVFLAFGFILHQKHKKKTEIEKWKVLKQGD